MNQSIRRIFDAYALLLLIAVVLPPWSGTNGDSFATPRATVVFAWIWSPPVFPGWYFVPDYPRLLLEILSLTQVVVLAAALLWDRGGVAPPPENSPPS